MAGIPAISGFSAPGVGGIPSGIIPPLGSFNIAAGIPFGAGASMTPSAAVHAGREPRATGNSTLPNRLSNSAEQSPLNPMLVFDLIKMGLAPFQSPSSGSGLPGFAPAVSGSGMMSAPAGPALSGQLAGAAPVPQSGGKGIVG